MISNGLYRLGRGSARRPWVVIGAWVVLVLVAVGASSAFGRDYEDSFRVPGLDSQKANDLIVAAGTGQAGMSAQVVVTPTDPAATFDSDRAARDGLAALQTRLEQLPKVVSISDPSGALSGGAGAAARSGVVSPDGRVALVRVQFATLDELSGDDFTAFKAVLADADDAPGSPVRVEAGGDLYFAFESSPANLGELIGLLVAAVILFVAFGSLVATVIPIVTSVVGLVVATSAMTLLARFMDVPNWAPVLGAMVGLGVGIDYALFIISRHRHYLAADVEVPESVGRALATAGQPVVFAGGIVMVSVLGLAVAGVPFMTSGGIALALMVAVMVAVSITLLPALLGLSRHAITRLGFTRSGHEHSPRWARWITHVTRFSWTYGIAVVAVLVALAAPMLSLRPGIPDDGTLPTTRTERQAYDLVAEGFGPGRNGPFVVAIDTASDPAAVARLVDGLTRDPGVASVATPSPATPTGIVTLVAFPTTGPQDEATRDTVARVRAEVIPAALAGSSAQAFVGGQMVNFADVGIRVNERLPWFVAAVLGMSFLLLMLVFRSVLVPLKAVLLNLLSIGAAYGVMVMVFQWGWGAGLIGLTATVPIVSFIPMFMFAILFGLSMDYEVFLLSRIREEYVAGADNRTSIVRGISGTARVITSAALIMIGVFLAFVAGEDPATKMFGLGLATAIFIDATLVRMVLVPATMTLLGDANWWLPRWLDRILPRVELERPDPAPEQAVPARV
jgi:RND superfamily putative drug exporter